VSKNRRVVFVLPVPKSDLQTLNLKCFQEKQKALTGALAHC